MKLEGEEMTYTLADYDLKPNDWVKVRNGWYEYYGIGPVRFEKGRAQKFIDMMDFVEPDTEVLAVLRPSTIIRDTLDIWKGEEFTTLISFLKVLPRNKGEPKKEPTSIDILQSRVEQIEKKLEELTMKRPFQNY